MTKWTVVLAHAVTGRRNTVDVLAVDESDAFRQAMLCFHGDWMPTHAVQVTKDDEE